MAQPSTRQELIDYCKRKLGYPVLEINVADEQIEDLVDDAIQLFQDRHFDGVTPTFLKYKVTQQDIDRGRAKPPNGPGIASTSATANIVGTATTFTFYENSNYLQVPPDVIGVTRIFHFDSTNTVTNNMFSVRYQLFLNDIYYWGSTELLTYSMVKRYLEDMEWLLTTQKQIRFNKRSDRLYLDIDWSSLSPDQYFIIDCHRAINPNESSQVWNDLFLKKYLTALIKKQWGQNLIKFNGVKLPGGIEFNGRQLYEDGQREIDDLMEKMSNTYELPPLDMIG